MYRPSSHQNYPKMANSPKISHIFRHGTLATQTRDESKVASLYAGIEVLSFNESGHPTPISPYPYT
jgi:hypothetical protein